MNDQWWNNSDTLFSVASHAVDSGELASAEDVLAFFEKPYNYPELLQLWEDAEV